MAPLEFATGLFINYGATNRNVFGSIVGWEE